MKKEKDELKKTILSKKEPELEDLAISQPMHIYTKKWEHLLWREH